MVDQSIQVNINEVNQALERKDSLDVIKWAYKTYGDKLVYACSMGAEGMVLIDLISKVRPDAPVIFLDTDFHFSETYELIERVKERYPKLQLKLVKPELTPEEQAETYGDRLWERQPDLCCKLRKLVPLEKELAQYDAWMSGLRRDQSPTRKNTQFVNEDRRFGSTKICPLIHWTSEEIWMYIELHQLPYNDLHDKQYPSIGCEYCTRPVKEGEDERAGRWSNTSKTECGLHQ
ncbi:phosphoadenylyl-sulfate reductase [Halalkalibacterium halodurans]|jgi:phosphoadenosine phosphosulfate reductase|uniref:phosphoadenylyl-sulfate reductase n=1 Tax=Halalkalibacterium halodurans TaxID=86665 RepID=UPI0006A9DB05|nr:phosphoadenylyl-sulfate reductase [Halalkalibacterium halodurans]MDY7222006.1 phosphoadenylyl-sulfate reductase [Halalkalibacterium halodurans]MDY7241282.1 phosphoadenylyl-sulfate reductase [Halalkalibacterium halodurans]MED3646905.1 phosphoadenylyl-sulfate reductase [Halalkalibacterium halodurans]MED4162834.1 phosphoadenylyl-sulfate reductase [Halalkalibacterium halodurans]TES55029.1 phosphoadenylyl-sulfate reductase [Halalkalibacterium halodurans]